MGVGSVGLLYATVRRWSGPAAGLLAGAVLALTPVAVLMFRFNNPDALLVLLLVAAAYATAAGRRDGVAPAGWCSPARWSALGFLTKMLQALLVRARRSPWSTWSPRRPRSAGGSATCSPPGWPLLVSAGWWVAIVELVPASARPYIGGSQHNSILELTLGYNGLGRLTGDETGSVGGGGGSRTGMWGQTGLFRLFNSEIGGQVAWLLPAALILLRRRAVADRRGRRGPTAVRAGAAAVGRLAARHRR